MSKIYYLCTTKQRSGREEKGALEPIPNVTASDPYRAQFVKRFREDPDFRTNYVGYDPDKDGSIDAYLRRYEDFVRPGFKNVPSLDSG